jgi:signal transduction histidine kinase/CheY-like chemotaxis protein
MRITQKISLALAAAFIAVCALLWVALQASVAPQFEAFEVEKATDNFERAQNAVQRELQLLEAYRSDYGVWDDAYDYMSAGDQAFMAQQLPLSLLKEINLNLFVYMDAGRSFAEGVAIAPDMSGRVDVSAYIPLGFEDWAAFDAQIGTGDIRQTVLKTPAGLMLAAYGPVTRTDGEGEGVGHLLTGKLVTPAFLEQLRRQTRVEMNIEPLSGQAALTALSEQSVTRGSNGLSIAAPVAGLDGAPVAILAATTPAEITAIGERTLISAFAWLAAVIILFIGIVSELIKRIAVKPVERLTEIMVNANAERADRDDELAARQDEIGVLYDSFTNLIERVEERTAELASALTAAEAAERAKTQFLANMSHEIRTPMNGVMGMADLLANTPLNETQRTFINVIVKSSDALLTIINDILDFSKLDAGMTALNSAPFTLADIVEDVSTLVAARAVEKDLEIAVRIDPKLPSGFRGDAGRLRQILINLAGNAVKFTDKGYVLIDVSPVCEADGERVALKFSVIDTGIGIPENKRAEIFEKFSQADASSTRAYEGTGLGLAIAKALVELMGGEIGVDSTPGYGSVFWFTIALPMAKAPRAEDAESLPDDVSARILVIDDNDVNRRILAEQADAWGFPCTVCASGAEGLAQLSKAAAAGDPFDAVIMDYHMPAMNGAQATQRIRADERIASTPVVLLTSVDQANDGDRFTALGVDAHLIKPARSGALLRAITQVVHKTRTAPAATALLTGASEEEAEETAPAPDANTLAAEVAPDVDVLVAEDNEVNRLVMSHILKAEGVTFEMAVNGRDAVEQYRRFNPKIILMDVSMPEMNGFEATAAIRLLEAETGARVRIIGVTAHAVKGDRDDCIRAGMDDYMSKPVSPRTLSEKIEQHLRIAASNAA